ncbi:MAG: hypothetical protein HZB42_07655 [Sphingobacteriales bacterium]|nr:hypothetical protein [Sphingobacteriales bacterium]
MIRGFFIILSFFICSFLSAQQNRIKLGVLILPSASFPGFIIGSAGYERLNKNLNSSWQFSFNKSSGSFGTDAGDENRTWGTIEKIYYNKISGSKITWSFSFFTETGIREKLAGHVYVTPEKTFRKTKKFEINPGAGLGLQGRFHKRWGIEIIGGPKLIIANGKDYYYNSIIKQIFTESVHETKLGFRLMGMISYQFSYNVR